MAGAADPLEDAHFAGRQDRAGSLQAAQGDLVIEARTRADGIDGDVNAKIQGEQIERRVQHAHMGFDAAQHQLRPSFAMERLHDAGHGTATEGDLVRPLRQLLGQVRHGRAEAARILLGTLYRHVQQAGGVEKKGDVAHQDVGVENHGDEFFLHVDDEQAGIGGRHLRGVRHGALLSRRESPCSGCYRASGKRQGIGECRVGRTLPRGCWPREFG